MINMENKKIKVVRRIWVQYICIYDLSFLCVVISGHQTNRSCSFVKETLVY